MNTSCKTSKREAHTLETIIESSISNAGDKIYNKDGNYLLVIEALTSENEFIKFIVLDTNTMRIVLEKKIRPGHVRWIDNATIEVLNIPGMIPANKKADDYIQRITISKPTSNQ